MALYNSVIMRHLQGLNSKTNLLYNYQNYRVFGLFPSSGILDTRKHDVSETRSV
jgi:hypothetical protein